MGVFVWDLALFLFVLVPLCRLPRFRWRNASLAGGFAGRRFLCGRGFRWFILIDLLISRTYVPVQSLAAYSHARTEPL